MHKIRNRGIPMVNAIIAITECALVVYAPPLPQTNAYSTTWHGFHPSKQTPTATNHACLMHPINANSKKIYRKKQVIIDAVWAVSK